MTNLQMIPRQLVALALVTSMLTGCALIVPTVKPEMERPPMRPVTLNAAMDYAESAKDAYQSAIREYGWLPNVLALTLIPLGAATLGLGITGTNPKAITELGLITGAGLALGGWFQNKPRVRVYNTGFQAVTCLLQSIKPLRLVEPVKFNSAIVNDDSITTHRGKLAEYMEAIKQQLPVPTNPMDSIQRLFDEADRIYKETEPIQTDGYKLYVAVEGAGEDLVQNVDQIVGKVNAAVLETEPDVRTLASVIGGLSVVKPETKDTKGGPVPSPGNLTGNEKQDAKSRLGARNLFTQTGTPLDVDKVVEEMGKVREKATIVQAQLNVTRSTSAPDMATCMSPLDTSLILKVIPEGDIEISPSQTRRIVIAGGKSPYTAKWLTEPIPKDSIRKPEAKMDGGSFYVELVAEPNAKGGPYELHIADILNIGKIVKVTVKNTLSATAPQVSIRANGQPQRIQIKGGNPERYEHREVGLNTVQVSFAPVDADRAGRPLVITPGATPQGGTILVMDTSRPGEVLSIPVTVDNVQ